MNRLLIRKTLWFGALFVFLALEPTRCGVLPLNVQAAEFPPTIIIISGETSQGFPYLFGGLGSDEREAMAQRANEFNVKLVFAAKGGAFVSGVTLAINNTKGLQIAKLVTEGPWFYIQLPPGSYSVEATFQGQSKKTSGLRVLQGKHVQQSFIWDLGGTDGP